MQMQKSHIFLLSFLVIGCSQTTPSNDHATSSTQSTQKTASQDDVASTTPPRTRAPVKLGSSTSAQVAEVTLTPAETLESVMQALRPLQILMGKWTGTTRKAILDEPQWVWDLQTNPQQPALKMESAKGFYIRQGRLTFLTKEQQYELQMVDGENQKRTLRGTFTEPVLDVPGEDKQTHRTYKLTLTETSESTPNEIWQVVINQQDNNRYLMEWNRKRGAGTFTRVDTVNTMREGTSFAVSDTDYKDKECVISQGLGTIQVNHQGRTYWVCCTGCKSAFEAEPERWIAKYEALKKSRMQK